MNVVLLMLAVTACYTFTSLSDKYAVSEAGFSGDEFTFLMCSSMAVFIGFTLPFQELYFSLSWQSFAAILLIAMCKILEFQMSAAVLKLLSAFELKAWLGVTLFASYITDVVMGDSLSVIKLLCITGAAAGLMLIAATGKNGKREYKKIALPLLMYLAAKYGYGLVIRTFSPYVSSTMQLVPALALVALVMLLKIKPSEVIKKNKNGAMKVILARIPNAAGMLMENAVIAISLANYSFIQPMILVTLFVIGLIRREHCSRLNIAGGVVCVLSVVAFQIV